MPSYKKDVRKCCVCHNHDDKTHMIRIVKNKSGEIFVDESKKADGRGVWLHDTEECKNKAVKRKLLNAALKCAVSQEIYDRL